MNEKKNFLSCEKRIVFELLMLAAGMMGAYTFNLRGGVFCNAQTANFVMMAVKLGQKDWIGGIYFLIPIGAYFAGSVISEIVPKPIKKITLFRWDTWLIGFEAAVLIAVGFIPLSVSDHVVQVIINFICSMQYNTFRQAESIPMATTFCTNHLRQTGIWTVKTIKNRNAESFERLRSHAMMLAVFFLGGLAETVACDLVSEKAIWLAIIPLGINLIILIYADLVKEKELMEKVPMGH
ncbi:MAG: DUF1275 domain-containing protein [Firmicutes bacterium]|nr:DUF1275 domain-containing protein [Bacillota bacterium]